MRVLGFVVFLAFAAIGSVGCVGAMTIEDGGLLPEDDGGPRLEDGGVPSEDGAMVLVDAGEGDAPPVDGGPTPGDDASAPPDDAPLPIDIYTRAGFIEWYAHAWCDALWTDCGCRPTAYPTIEDCYAARAEAASNDYPSANFDDTRVDGYVELFAEASAGCQDLSTEEFRTTWPFPGPVPVDGDCTDYSQCESLNCVYDGITRTQTCRDPASASPRRDFC